MRRVTREFIALRQPRCDYQMMVIGGVDRSRIYEGETDCLDNVQREIQGRSDLLVCSGWLVGPYNSELDRTMIIPWWWNVEVNAQKQFRHYDVTPYADSDIEFEYVVDRDITEYIRDPLNTLKSSIPDPLMYSAGVFYSYDPESDQRVALGDLSLASIFHSQRRSIITLDVGAVNNSSLIGAMNTGPSPGNIIIQI